MCVKINFSKILNVNVVCSSELMMEVQKDILQGQAGNQVFKHDLGKLAKGRYLIAGKLVAFSILHGGPGLPVLNSQLYDLMIGRDMQGDADIDNCVVDYETTNRFHMVCTYIILYICCPFRSET